MNLLLGKAISGKKLLLALIAWGSIGNSNWYIFVVLCLYVITFLSFTIAKNNKGLGFALTLVLSAGLIAALYLTKERWWYDTILCYALGMGYYLGKDKIEAILCKNIIVYCVALFICTAVWALCAVVLNGLVFTLIRHLAFISVIVLLTMRVSIDNKILRFFGKHLFSIYILQGIKFKSVSKIIPRTFPA